MSVFETLRRSPEEWNHPRWPRQVVPLVAGAGGAGGAVLGTLLTLGSGGTALAAGAGAALCTLFGFVVLAALD